MNIRNIIKDNQTYLKYFDYYKKLGYTDNQSFILAVFPYNNYNDAFNYFLVKYEKEKSNLSLCDYLMDIFLKEYEKSKNVLLNKGDIAYIFSNCEEYKQNSNFNDFNDLDDFSGCGLFGCSNSVQSFMPQSFSNNPTYKASSNNIRKMSVSLNSLDSFSEEVEEADGGFYDDLFDESMAFSGATFLNNEATFKEQVNNLSTASYQDIEEKGFRNVLVSPTSTFRMTSNTAAFGNLRKNRSFGISRSMVRIEEVLNNFKYELSKPTNRMFNINTQVCDKPDSKNKLLFIGVQGKDIKPSRQNITLLLDVSGSMSSNNENTQLAMMTIISQLNEGDILSLVTYCDRDKVVFENKVVSEKTIKDDFISELYKITINGCTYGSKGIETAYKLAKRTYISDGINRVILMTDGDLNFGITENGQLKDFILSKKDDGIFLSVLGTGLFNYKDDKLETLSKNGNGNYCTIDCLEDVEENILNNYNSLVYTIAKDVKAQVEFNPKFVKEYRLIGYENRNLNHEDFKNDEVISEPFGCGSYGIALYELVMQNGDKIEKSDLEYQKPVLVDSDNICTVKVRYKKPLKEISEETSVKVRNKDNGLTNNLLLAYTIYNICEKLRDSEFADTKYLESLKDTIPTHLLNDLYLKNKEKFDVLLGLI